MPNGPQVVTSGDGTAIGTGVTLPVSGEGAVAFQISGTFNAFYRFEGTLDGVSWTILKARPVGASTFGVSFSAAGIYIVNVSGLSMVRVNVTTYTSGTVNVFAQAGLAGDAGGGATAELQTATNDLLDSQALGSEAHIGQVGGTTVPITASKTRPNDTISYAANDAIAEATSGATVWTWTGAARISGGSGLIVGVEVKSSTPTNVARLEIDLYTAAPAIVVVDNAECTQLVADIGIYVGTITCPALAKQTPNSTFAKAQDNTIRQAFKCGASANLVGQVRTLDAFATLSLGVYYVTLFILQD